MTRTTFAVVAAVFLFAACDKAQPVEPPVAQTPPPSTAAQSPSDLTFEDAVAKFDAATQHLVWVLPPGVIAQGPFSAQVVIKADGAVALDKTIPLTAEKPAAGSRPEYPAGAEVLRLSTDATYPQHLKEIQDAMEGIKAKLGPGHGELAAEVRGSGRTAVNDANSDFAGGYAVAAVRFSHVLVNRDGTRVDVLLRVDNLFDRRYAGSVIVNDANGRFFETGAPRAFLLALRIGATR